MAKKKNSDLGKSVRFWDQMGDGAIRAIQAVICFALALLSLLAVFGKAGWGNYVYTWLEHLLGIGYFLIPIILAMLGISFLRGMERRLETPRVIGAVLFFMSGLGLIYLISDTAAGVLGRWITVPLLRSLDTWATVTLLVALFIVSLIMIFEWEMTSSWLMFWKRDKEDGEKRKEKGGRET